MTDLKELRIKTEEQTLEIYHPVTGAPTGIIFKILSPELPKVREKMRAIDQQMLDRASVGEDGKMRVTVTTEESEHIGYQRLAACIVGWEGLTDDGRELAFTDGNVIMVLRDFSFMRQQIETFIHNRANFFPVPNASLSNTPDTSSDSTGPTSEE